MDVLFLGSYAVGRQTIMSRFIFREGPAGTGKTTSAVRHIRSLLDDGVPSEQILVLVPQRTLGTVYQLAFNDPQWPNGAYSDVLTFGGLVRRSLETFWPLVAERAGVGDRQREPAFLTIETAQYYLWGFVTEALKTGVFDSVSLTPFAIMRQTLDNLSKAAVNQFSLDEIGDRLVTAWGDRHTSRPPVYRASVDVARQYREQSLANNLLDFSLQIDLFMKFLLDEPLYRQFLTARYRYLVADNLEESFPVVYDFLRWWWPDLESALLVYDTDAGYRSFLGADPAGMAKLADMCDSTEAFVDPVAASPSTAALAAEYDRLLNSVKDDQLPFEISPRAAVELSTNRFFPQMIDWAVNKVVELVHEGVPPREIVMVAPFLGDSLRFALTVRLQEQRVPVIAHRPSRAVRDEPSARAMLTFLALAHPAWGISPPVMDVATALRLAIADLDPVRAWLLAQIVYRSGRSELGSFDAIRSEMQQRVSFRAGARYEQLRTWLLDYQSDAVDPYPPDHFFRRLFGEVMAQPGFGFHDDLEAGRVVAELVESARKFRQTVTLGNSEAVSDWSAISRSYYDLVQEGLLAAQHVSSWNEEDQDAVFLVPATTFVMRNRWVDYQFWLDVGSTQWWERLEQPLTHPYVLTRNYPADQMWTDDMEFAIRQDTLRRLIVGLTRRCRKKTFACVADLGEQGYEQRGPLLHMMQRLIQRYPAVQDEEA